MSRKPDEERPPFEGMEQPEDLQESIHKLEGRWFGDARAVFEGVEVKLIYFGINEHVGTDTFEAHAHPFSELFYTSSGEGLLTRGDREEPCRGGHIYIARPGEEHASAWRVVNDEPWRASIFQFDIGLSDDLHIDSDLSLAQQFAPFYSYFFLQRNDSYQLPPVDHVSVEQYAECVLRTMRERPASGPACIIGLWLFLVSVISESLRRSGTAQGTGAILQPTDKERLLFKAKKLLEDPACDDIDIAGISQKAGMSSYHFIREFGHMFGISPQKYRHAVMMGRAGKVLTQTDDSVSAIAERYGYADASSFSKSFRKHFGVSPQQYRSSWSKLG
ncbi:MAG: AraC family transcriptional regulator [Verrucomicrobia bacterium]|nr:AraC family transcriptional regulator [Verrucomicrobiota bacterium]